MQAPQYRPQGAASFSSARLKFFTNRIFWV